MRKVWNAFVNSDQIVATQNYSARSSFTSGSPSRTPTRSYNDRSIITSICTRISIDVSDVLIRHVQLDQHGRYLNDVESSLNSCLSWEPNLDQGPRAFRQDIARTILDRGVATIVPVDTTVNPETREVFDIFSLRVGTIDSGGWYADHVRTHIWNEKTGKRQEVIVSKRYTAIIENPLYSVMNETLSTFQRLSRKLTLLDAVEEQASSGKLDILIQVPYAVKSTARQEQADQRRTDIEMQLKGSQYGIAYIDGTEKVVQLNRAAENNLLKTVEYLTNMLYGQLGITEEIMNGTADEATMLNYIQRTIKPLVDAIVEGMQRAFIGPVGRRNSERIMYFTDPFKLVAMKDIAEIGDKLSRNEVITPNELRQVIGLRPSADPKADELANSNMPERAVNVNVGTSPGEKDSNATFTPPAANGRRNT